ncbi:MAG TPA: FAD-dependent oxidoreductase [Gemmatimonadales bacterium]
MAETFDAVIIGAGIMGCSGAYQLARRGMRVVVLEKNGICSGGTGRSSSIIRQHYSNELTARMALHSLRVFQRFDEAVGGDAGFRETGFVAIAAANNSAGLAANVALQQSLGIRTTLVGREELREILPDTEVDDLVAGAFESESGYADPHLTTLAYADAARRHGAMIVPYNEVTGIRFTGGRVQGVDTRAGPFDAPMVINCAGPWGARVAALAGVVVPIDACRVQVGVFAHDAAQARTHPVVLDFVHGTYIRPETGNLTLAGLIDPAEANAVVDPDDYPEHSDAEFDAELVERLLRRFRFMEGAGLRQGFASLYGVTPDWHPIMDELPAGSGCYLCAGFSGHGFKLGPAVGSMLADMVTAEAASGFDWTVFRASRYAAQTPVRGQYEYSIAG